MDKLNFGWLIENEVAGHSEPTDSDDLNWLFGEGIRALVRLSTGPRVLPRQVKALGMDDLYEPVKDFTAPSHEQLSRIIDFMLESVWKGKPVGVSCGAGIGRTGTVLACYLAKRWNSAKGLVIEVRRNRPGAVETGEQLNAIEGYLRQVLKEALGEDESGGAPALKSKPKPADPAGKDNPPLAPSSATNKPELDALMKKYSMHPQAALSSEDTLNRLKKIAAERNYGRGEGHANIVRALSLSLYKQIVDLGFFPKVNRGDLLLESAAYLHDFGVPRHDDVDGLPEESHNEYGFQLLRPRLAEPDASALLNESERAIVLYCVLWHKGNEFTTRPEVQIEPDSLVTATQLASIIRIGDGLSFPYGEPTKKVTVRLDGQTLIISACPSSFGDSLATQVNKANSQKKNLLEQLLIGKAPHHITHIEVRRCVHPGC